jgi:iron(III) transport system ATP-binding protein
MANAAMTASRPGTGQRADAPAIEVRGLRKSFGDTEVLRDADLVVPQGSTMALLGPSGCGKTTLLRAIAGLATPDAGSIAIAGTTVHGPRVDVPPERRRIGMVFQDWALFPHMTVGRNVGYGLTREQRRSGRIEESLELVGLGGYGTRMPSTLSGGQQQRVALARALAPRPQAILLDEPFSNLDTALRVQVRTEVHSLLQDLGVTTVFVTHDQEEAFVLGDQVAVMSDGVIAQQATPAEVYDAPATRWIASFVGAANLVPGDADGDRARTPFGVVRLRSPRVGPVEVVLRPEQVHLERTLPADVERGAGATVELIEFYGHDHVTIARLDDGTEVRSRRAGAPLLHRGDQVRVELPDEPVVAFGAED